MAEQGGERVAVLASFFLRRRPGALPLWHDGQVCHFPKLSHGRKPLKGLR